MSNANDWIRAQANRRTIPADATTEQASAHIRALAGRGVVTVTDTAPMHPMNAALRRMAGVHRDDD